MAQNSESAVPMDQLPALAQTEHTISPDEADRLGNALAKAFGRQNLRKCSKLFGVLGLLYAAGWWAFTGDAGLALLIALIGIPVGLVCAVLGLVVVSRTRRFGIGRLAHVAVDRLGTHVRNVITIDGCVVHGRDGATYLRWHAYDVSRQGDLVILRTKQNKVTLLQVFPADLFPEQALELLAKPSPAKP